MLFLRRVLRQWGGGGCSGGWGDGEGHLGPRGLREAEHSCSSILASSNATAGGGLDVLICPATKSGSQPLWRGVEDLGKDCLCDGYWGHL
jgi:hypothetical protein